MNEIKDQKKKTTLNEKGIINKLFADFLNECIYSRRLRSETIRGYKAVFDLFSKIVPEVTTIESLTPEMLTEFFKRIETRERIVGKNQIKIGVKKSTIKTQWSKLNVFFAWLEKKGHIEENPLKDIRPPQVSYDDFRRLNDPDIHRIYSAITLHSSNPLLLRRDTMMVSLLLFCGLRKGELISLQIKDIDLEKKVLTVKGETSKSKKSRFLKIHETLAMHLKDYFRERNTHNLKTECLIISNKGDRGLSYEGLKHWVKNLVKKSGARFHLHEFRHTFACKLVEADVNLFKIQKMMGHTNITMTMKYARSIKTEDMAEDIAKISI